MYSTLKTYNANSNAPQGAVSMNNNIVPLKTVTPAFGGFSYQNALGYQQNYIRQQPPTQNYNNIEKAYSSCKGF